MRIVPIFFLFMLLGQASIAFSSDILKVLWHVWGELKPQEKILLGERFVIDVLAETAYGSIIDVQSLNESTAGFVGSSQLGAALGSATYIDNTFRGSAQNWNYSATGHLTAQLAGAIIGSLAEKPASIRFRTRYTVKNGISGVIYVDEIKSSAFRHSLGLCVTLNPIHPVESDFCNITCEQFLAKHIRNFSNVNIEAAWQPPPPQKSAQQESTNDLVICKFGVSRPVPVSGQICESAGGLVMLR